IELRPIRQKVTPNHSGLIKAAASGARALFLDRRFRSEKVPCTKRYSHMGSGFVSLFNPLVFIKYMY
ncbi:hypothetical protein LEMLEM_LOCUS11383, partial [Lemmus lemmus]